MSYIPTALTLVVAALVCWPSPRVQRAMLLGLALLVRLAVVAASTALGAAAPFLDELSPAQAEPLHAAAGLVGLDPAPACAAVGALLALAAVPLLAGIDFARSLVGTRVALQPLIDAVRQAQRPAPPAAERPVAAVPGVPASVGRQRLGDLLS